MQRRDLVATDTESGTIGYASPQTVFNRVSGTITELPAIGQVIKPGQTLHQLDGSPVVLFNGTTPAYRDLTSSDSDGADILELNGDLKSLGFDSDDPITVNDEWQAATTNAVDEWQGSLGETETGTITLGQIVFLPGAQRITSVDTVLGSTGAASSAASSTADNSASTSLTPLAPRAQFVSLTSTSTTAQPASGTEPASGTGSAPGSGLGTGSGPGSSAAGAGAGSSAGTGVSTAAQSPCPAPGASPQPGVTTTTATPTTPATTSTTPTCETADANATTTSPKATTTSPNTLITPRTSTTPTSTTPTSTNPGSAKSGSRSPSEEAVLLALLQAETLELRKTLTSSSGSSRSSATGSGASGATSSGTTGSSRGSATGGGVSAATGVGASSSPASTSGSSGTGSSTGSAASTASAGSSAEAILQTTSNQLLVIVDLDATKQSEAVVGEPVSVELPAGNTMGGRITQVSPTAQTSSSSSSTTAGASAPSATIPVTIKILGRYPTVGLDQAAVSVNFEQQVEKNVLSVPVTALLATAGGGYAVQEAGTPHRLLPVTPGLFAAGYVQISGADIYSGLQVTDSQG